MPPVTVAERIGAFVVALDWNMVPELVGDRTRDRVLDALATAVAGRVADPYKPIARMIGQGTVGDASLLASGTSTDIGMAAFANGVAVHALLYEDLNPACADHPGPVIVPAALAAAEAGAAGRTGKPTIGDFLCGVLAGYEVQAWLGVLAGQGVIARGFRTTSVFGAVAAAVAAARVWRLPAERITAAAAIGANAAGGMTEAWSHGTHEPYLQAGFAAQQGILAARLADAGSHASGPVFEGPNGYLRAFADAAYRPAPDLGNAWRILDIICKPYPCSGGKIGAIDSALAFLDGGFDPDGIESVRVWLPELYYGYPGANRQAPFETMSQAQASGQFCVAAALLGYPMDAIETFTRDFARDDIAALSRRVELHAQPDALLARVEVVLEDGTSLSRQADGRERLIPTIAGMSKKLAELTRGIWRDGAAEGVLAAITGPENVFANVLSGHLRYAR